MKSLFVAGNSYGRSRGLPTRHLKTREKEMECETQVQLLRSKEMFNIFLFWDVTSHDV
jgi:hypothetical protein